MLTAERLRELLDYCPLTGQFTRRVARGGVPAGTAVGTRHGEGYLVVRVDKKLYLAHRLAWLHANGDWPRGKLDHKDNNRQNNALQNLREATNAQNARNRSIGASNTSGVKGVRWYKGREKWVASVKVNGRDKHLGYFSNLTAAAAAVSKARDALHGDFAHHG